MNAFLQTLPLALTPLTPIHIGCGQDFEPTNYVIDEAVLYHFEPARLALSREDREALIAAVNGRSDEAILSVQRFFHARKERCAAVAHAALGVAPGVVAQYRRRIGQVAQHETGGRRVANLLEIERTAHHPHSGLPYLPGSSIKGAMRTAWLDGLNQGRSRPSEDRNAQDLEKRLLDSQAGFHADPFRLLHMADCWGAELEARIVFATNHKKRLVHDRNGQVVQARGPSTRREVISGGQHRALAGEIRFNTLADINERSRTPAPEQRIPDLLQLARACNAYYLPRLQTLIELLDTRRFATPEWLAGLKDLLAALQPQFDEGRLMLLRVGRHSGAENVTLDGVRSIRIMRGRGQQPDWSSEGAKTVWLAAEQEDARTDMQPFGWLLLETASAPPIPALERWCQSQTGTRLAEVRQQLLARREQAAADAQHRLQQEAERQAAEQAAAAADAARQAARAQLSDEGRLIADFVLGCETRSKNGRKDPFNPGNGLYAEALRLSRAALAEGSSWSESDRLQLATAMKEWLPQVIDKLDRKDDWKDARKKLQLARLSGEQP